MGALWGIIKYYVFTKEGREYLRENHKRLAQRRQEEEQKQRLEAQRKKKEEEESSKKT